jgi:hypothetical protein
MSNCSLSTAVPESGYTSRRAEWLPPIQPCLRIAIMSYLLARMDVVVVGLGAALVSLDSSGPVFAYGQPGVILVAESGNNGRHITL